MAVDGGRDYLRRLWGSSARYTELSEQTCPLCGCLRPDDPERCDICGHDGCAGCVKDGVCSLCHDIEKERNT